ncbi:MAG TPA: hypothetical protein VK588_13035 [Chitinophagaceae bacterium]|nr:hypothetical protein [Chitinophagaceae bacterium]
MEPKTYTARKLKPNGKESWVLEFRHPLLKDPSGKNGKKIRKGLGTKVEPEADELVRQMNILLSDETYWQPSSRQQAEDKFNSGIVNAFYEGIEYTLIDYDKIREERIPLKTKQDGFSSILLLGATGAGKTTLLRQIMGTDPISERFPATSTSRTTVFDTEIILSDGNYKGIVTFFTEGETRQMIRDSIQKSMIEFLTRKEDSHILRVFLEDKDQRFRLSYILGKIKENKKYNDFESLFEDTELQTADIKITDEEQHEFEKKINKYVSKIKEIAFYVIEQNNLKYNPNGKLSEDESKILEEIIEAEIDEYDGEDLVDLVDEILDDIKERFKLLDPANLETEKLGWPKYWFKESNDRTDFLKSIRFFSSNTSTMFGKLLTPLVSGLRVEGPFKPDFLTKIPKLVIYDGEGLGHISDTASSLPYKTIKKFDLSDAIVLVDNSQSPMLSASHAVIKSTAITGYSEKLFLCFTHFDAVKGDNLPTIGAKIEHIFGSVDNVLAKLKTELEYDISKYFISNLHNSAYYFASLDEKITESTKFKFTINQLVKLVTDLELSGFTQIEKSQTTPTYDISTLIFKIRKATVEFHNKWEGYLFGTSIIPKQHFTRLKALTLRLGYRGETEYNGLAPISDFVSDFSTQISNFLSAPLNWSTSATTPTEEEKQRIISEIKQKISKKIIEYAIVSLKINKISDWQKAYSFKGNGSSYDRAKKINEIYEEVAPIPQDEINTSTKKFLKIIMKIITDTIEENGGIVTSIFMD